MVKGFGEYASAQKDRTDSGYPPKVRQITLRATVCAKGHQTETP